MAQNITLLGASYTDVPAVELPKTGGGTASFTDVTDTTAAAADVASGKYFYTSSGVRTEGSGSAGTWMTTSFTANGQSSMSFSTSGTAKAFVVCLTSGQTNTSLLSPGLTTGVVYTGGSTGTANVLTYSSNRIMPSTASCTPTITSSSVSINLSKNTVYNGTYSVHYLV